MYVIGGGQHIPNSIPYSSIKIAKLDILDAIPYFDLIKNTWHFVLTTGCRRTITKHCDVIEGFPQKRLYHSWTSTQDGMFYMVGGLQTRNTRISPEKSTRIPFNDVWKLDCSNLTWEFLGNLPDFSLYTWGVAFSSCCLNHPTNDTLHIFGGTKRCLKEGVEDVKMNSLFSIELGVPTLQKICDKTIKKYR